MGKKITKKTHTQKGRLAFLFSFFFLNLALILNLALLVCQPFHETQLNHYSDTILCSENEVATTTVLSI